MKGFIVDMNELITSTALASGAFGVIITNKSGAFTLDCSGIDSEGKQYSWMYESLKLGDCVTIKYEDLDELNLTVPRKVKEVGGSDEELLDEYKRLKQELIDSGIL